MRASATFMQALRHGLDESRVEQALDDGLITARQAASALKSIRDVKAIRANPIRTQAVQVGGQFIGEVVFDGAGWIGRRYGKDYPSGSVFGSEAEAHDYVLGL